MVEGGSLELGVSTTTEVRYLGCYRLKAKQPCEDPLRWAGLAYTECSWNRNENVVGQASIKTLSPAAISNKVFIV